jgi:hypothetical protein
MLQLLSIVGGLTSWAAPEDTYVLRGKKDGLQAPPEKIRVNLKELLSTMNPAADFDLHPDDAVFVPGLNGNADQVMAATSRIGKPHRHPVESGGVGMRCLKRGGCVGTSR